MTPGPATPPPRRPGGPRLPTTLLSQVLVWIAAGEGAPGPVARSGTSGPGVRPTQEHSTSRNVANRRTSDVRGNEAEGSLRSEPGLQSDRDRRQRLADGAVHRGGVGDRLELVRIDPRDAGLGIEVDPRDREPLIALVQVH
jgi:hypothetical protein